MVSRRKNASRQDAARNPEASSRQPGSARAPRAGRARVVIRVLLLLALLGLFAVYTVMSVDDYLDVSEVRVPQVVGMSLDDAYAVFQSLDLSVTTYAENVPDAPVDSVTKQVPAAGAVVRRGRSISLGVHNPPESTQMPSLQSRTAEEAERLLANLGLYLGEITYAFSDAPEGTVIAQSPALGERVAPDSQIDVVVSRGQEVRTVVMPDLVGRSRANAKAALEEIGFRRIEEVATNISFDNPGNVSAQSPSAGQSVPVSAAITLYHTVENRSVVRVPDVRGESLEQARNRLRAAQLTVGWTENIADPEQASGVVSVSPSGYTLVGSPVLLRVNTPPAPEAAPDVATDPASGDPPRSRIGRILAGDDASSWTEAPADTQADAASGTAQPNTAQPDTAQPNTTQPDVSSALRESTALGSRSIAIRFNPNLYGFLQGQANDFRLVVIDDRGERVAIDRRLAEDEVLNTSVTVFGDATLQTYINGNFFQAWNP